MNMVKKKYVIVVLQRCFKIICKDVTEYRSREKNENKIHQFDQWKIKG